MYLCCGYGLCLFLRFIYWILERFRRVLRFPPPIKHSHVITELLLKVTLNTINWQCNTLLLFIGLRVWYIWLVFNPKKDIKGKDKLQFYSLVNLLINIILYICTCDYIALIIIFNMLSHLKPHFQCDITLRISILATQITSTHTRCEFR
jgi:hypothetical protein